MTAKMTMSRCGRRSSPPRTPCFKKSRFRRQCPLHASSANQSAAAYDKYDQGAGSQKKATSARTSAARARNCRPKNVWLTGNFTIGLQQPGRENRDHLRQERPHERDGHEREQNGRHGHDKTPLKKTAGLVNAGLNPVQLFGLRFYGGRQGLGFSLQTGVCFHISLKK